MLGQYNRIDKVKQNTCMGIETGYLLTGDNVDKDFEVDLTGSCWFNELEILEREKILDVVSVEDVKAFAKKHGITLQTDDGDGSKLIVGGSEDCFIFSDLQFDWM